MSGDILVLLTQRHNRGRQRGLRKIPGGVPVNPEAQVRSNATILNTWRENRSPHGRIGTSKSLLPTRCFVE